MSRTDHHTNRSERETHSRETNDGHGPEFIRGILHIAPRRHHRMPEAAVDVRERVLDMLPTPKAAKLPGLKAVSKGRREGDPFWLAYCRELDQERLNNLARIERDHKARIEATTKKENGMKRNRTIEFAQPRNVRVTDTGYRSTGSLPIAGANQGKYHATMDVETPTLMQIAAKRAQALGLR